MNDEVFKLRSGEYYTIGNYDIEFMAQELRWQLEKYICEDTVVLLCLSLDELKFSALLIYQACRRCGATMIRCGLADIERQMFLLEEQQVNIVIASKNAYKHIRNKVGSCQWILLDNFENIMSTKEDNLNILCRIYEFYDIPAVVFWEKNGEMCVPGYDVIEKEKEFVLKSKSMIKSFQISEQKICPKNTLSCEKQTESLANSLIELQLKQIIEQLGECNIDEEGTIVFTSLGSIELVIMIEEVFEIEILVDEVDMEQFRNIHTIARIVNHMLEGISDD